MESNAAPKDRGQKLQAFARCRDAHLHMYLWPLPR